MSPTSSPTRMAAGSNDGGHAAAQSSRPLPGSQPVGSCLRGGGRWREKAKVQILNEDTFLLRSRRLPDIDRGIPLCPPDRLTPRPSRADGQGPGHTARNHREGKRRRHVCVICRTLCPLPSPLTAILLGGDDILTPDRLRKLVRGEKGAEHSQHTQDEASYPLHVYPPK